MQGDRLLPLLRRGGQGAPAGEGKGQQGAGGVPGVPPVGPGEQDREGRDPGRRQGRGEGGRPDPRWDALPYQAAPGMGRGGGAVRPGAARGGLRLSAGRDRLPASGQPQNRGAAAGVHEGLRHPDGHVQPHGLPGYRIRLLSVHRGGPGDGLLLHERRHHGRRRRPIPDADREGGPAAEVGLRLPAVPGALRDPGGNPGDGQAVPGEGDWAGRHSAGLVLLGGREVGPEVLRQGAVPGSGRDGPAAPPGGRALHALHLAEHG